MSLLIFLCAQVGLTQGRVCNPQRDLKVYRFNVRSFAVFVGTLSRL